MATYTIGLNSGTQIVAMKATADPTVDGNWANVGGHINVGSAFGNIQSMWVVEDGGDLHVVTQQSLGTTSGRVAYHVFDPGTDTWTTRNEEVIITTLDAAGIAAVSIALRSDGDVIIGYAEVVAGAEHIHYARKEGGSWATGFVVDGAAPAEHYNGVVVVLGASDRVHFFYSNRSDDDFLHRSLSSANSLDTADQSVDASVNTVLFQMGGKAVAYVSGATKIRATYLDATNKVSMVELDSGADPTINTTADISANDYALGDANPQMCLAVDGTTIHLLYIDTTNDIFHVADVEGSPSENEIEDAVTAQGLSCNIYDRSGIKLAYLWNNNGTLTYDEVDIAGAETRQPLVGSGTLSGIQPIKGFGIVVPTEI